MKRKKTFHFIYLFIPIFIMTLLTLPLIFILVKRYYSPELLPFSLVNSIIMTSGIIINLFVFKQLSTKIKKTLLYTLILMLSMGFSFSGFIYVVIQHPLFFLYGLEVILSYILLIFLLISTLSIFCSMFLSYQNKINNESKLREEMERQIYSSRINPHFLFNSLNLMVSLLDDKDKAENVLICLSELLRFNLVVSKKRYIPLAEELDNIEKYLYIQKERFGKRLDYKIDGDTRFNIPPLILQPLVENSIKHNMSNVDHLLIKIKIIVQSNILEITVIDSCKAILESMIGMGSGLELTKKIVELNSGTLTIVDGGVKICLPGR